MEVVSSTSRAPSQPHLTASVVSVTALIASLTHRYAALDVNELLSGCWMGPCFTFTSADSDSNVKSLTEFYKDGTAFLWAAVPELCQLFWCLISSGDEKENPGFSSPAACLKQQDGAGGQKDLIISFHFQSGSLDFLSFRTQVITICTFIFYSFC